MLSHVTTSYCVVTKWMFKILLTHRASVLSHFVAESDSAAVLMSLCPPAKQNKTNANVNGDKNLVFTWGKSHTNHKQFREVVKIRIFYGQSDREGGGSARSALAVSKLSHFFHWTLILWCIEYTQNTFYLISQKCIFHAIFMVANDRPEGTGLLQMIVYRGQPLANDYPESCLFLVICSLSGVKHTTKKTRKTDSKVEGVCVCVNAYGQPDHKISVFTTSLRTCRKT